ncbi:MAG TPA: hypothetical protein VFX24_05995 [Ktedonobacterales bacterium]|nr:hypothetical protein [Ktedonobacterales bacterium]
MAETFDTSDPLIVMGEPESQQPPDDETAHAEIDIEALAEKVYRLMLAEIRLDRARGLSFDEGA